MPNPQRPLSNFDMQLAIARANRHPSTQPTPAGLSNADNRMILDFLPPVAMIPGGQQDFMKQALSPVMPAISAIVGFAQGGMDRARAEAQAQQEAQDEYAKNNEGTAAIADLTSPVPDELEGGIALGKIAGRMASKTVPKVSGAINHLVQAAKGIDDIRAAKGNLEDILHIANAARNAAAPEQEADTSSSQTFAPQDSGSHSDFPGAQAEPLDFSGLTPGGFDTSLSGQFGMFGNPRLRPEIFGDDSGVAFSLPSSASASAPAGMGVNLQEPNYLENGFTGAPAPTSGVNLNPGYGDTTQFSDPGISLTS